MWIGGWHALKADITRDQELRFTVHDSPDYHSLKVSVFNDDKKSDLIGETWIKLDEVVIPGGGRGDAWHALNYRGKYAGEVRMEMSYYDSRQPERPAPEHVRKHTPVKRRPLPSETATPSPSVTPAFGPRDYGRRRGLSITPENGSPAPGYPMDHHRRSTPGYANTPPIHESHEDMYHHHRQDPHAMPDFLPTLPPKQSSRARQPSHAHSQSYSGPPAPPSLSHSYSAPEVYGDHQPSVEDYYEEDDYHPGMVPGQSQYEDPYSPGTLPPLPPSHANTPPRRSHVSGISPLQGVERGYAPSSPASANYRNSPAYPTSPVGSSPGYGRQPHVARHSVSEPYFTTPPKTHPLSHEVRRSVSPQPYYGNSGYAEPHDYHFPDETPLIKPRAISPQPQRRSIGAIQNPIQTYAAARASPALDPAGRQVSRNIPIRKSISPRASQNGVPASGGIPYGPDSFDVHNPYARTSALEASSNPHSPYHIPASPRGASSGSFPSSAPSRPFDASRPITRFDGSEVDPSDHLPVDSWAPEPEQKTPTKTYAGSNRGFGPRGTPSPAPSATGPRKSNIIVNVRSKARSSDNVSTVGGASPVQAPGPGSVLREIDVPNPYASGGRFARFASQPDLSAPSAPSARSWGRRSYGQDEYEGSVQGSAYGGRRSYGGHDEWDSGSAAGYAPPKPPKVPLQARNAEFEGAGYGGSALSREMASIDIGGSRRGGGTMRSRGIRY